MTKEQALYIRKIMEDNSKTVTDEEASKHPEFVKKWKKKTEYKEGERVSFKIGKETFLYRVLKDHVSEKNRPPSIEPLLYKQI